MLPLIVAADTPLVAVIAIWFAVVKLTTSNSPLGDPVGVAVAVDVAVAVEVAVAVDVGTGVPVKVGVGDPTVQPAVVAIPNVQPPAKVPISVAASSTTYKLHVPFGSLPPKAEPKVSVPAVAGLR